MSDEGQAVLTWFARMIIATVLGFLAGAVCLAAGSTWMAILAAAFFTASAMYDFGTSDARRAED